MNYDSERPHQSKGNLPLVGHDLPGEAEPAGEVVCTARLGGVLKHYERKAV